MFQNKDPRKGRRRASGWTHEKLKGGGAFDGWVAGDTVWVLTHWNYRSVPCYAELTDGAIHCPYCGGKKEPVWIGYTPVYRDDERPVVVVVPDSMRDRLGQISTFDPVKVFRGKQRGDTICLIPRKDGQRYHTTLPSRKVGADIRGWLLVLWREAPLREFYAVTSDDIPEVVTPPAKNPDPNTDDGDRMLRALLARHKPPTRDEGLIGDALPPFSRNGTHADGD